LLQEACAIFAGRGYQQTRTQDICKAAQTNPAAVNYYFGGKDGLYTAVWDYALKLAVAETGEKMSLSNDKDRDWLYQYLYTSVLAVFNLGPRNYLRKLMEHELSKPSPLSETVMEHHIAPRMLDINKRLRRMLGPKTSEFQVTCCTVAIYSQCTALNLSRVLHQRLFDGQDPSEADIRKFAREMCAFVMGGIRAMKAVPEREKRSLG